MTDVTSCLLLLANATDWAFVGMFSIKSCTYMCVTDVTSYLFHLTNGTDWAFSSKRLLLVYSV